MTQAALDLVIAALETIRKESERGPRASRAVLARLQSGDPVALPLETLASLPERRRPSSQNKPELLTAIRQRVRARTKCEHLSRSRNQTVFRAGTSDAALMVIGEPARSDAEQHGQPFAR